MADLAAPHTALDDPYLEIEGARAYALATSMGVAAVFLRFSAPSLHAASAPYTI